MAQNPSQGTEKSKPAPSKTDEDAAPKFTIGLQGCAARPASFY